MTCERCYDQVNELQTPTCEERPENTFGAIGTYRCPDCETMLLVGSQHPLLCKACIEEVNRNAQV